MSDSAQSLNVSIKNILCFMCTHRYLFCCINFMTRGSFLEARCRCVMYVFYQKKIFLLIYCCKQLLMCASKSVNMVPKIL